MALTFVMALAILFSFRSPEHVARHGPARLGWAWQGMAWRGAAWLGLARQGKASNISPFGGVGLQGSAPRFIYGACFARK